MFHQIWKPLFKSALILFLFALPASKSRAQVVHMTISNVKSAKGQMLIAVFKDQKGFKDEVPFSKHRFAKTAVKNGHLQVSFEVPAGTYGIAVVDDENNSGKLEKNMIGIPKEAVGFSNFYLSGMSKPSFDDFKFVVKAPSVKVECKLRHF